MEGRTETTCLLSVQVENGTHPRKDPISPVHFVTPSAHSGRAKVQAISNQAATVFPFQNRCSELRVDAMNHSRLFTILFISSVASSMVAHGETWIVPAGVDDKLAVATNQTILIRRTTGPLSIRSMKADKELTVDIFSFDHVWIAGPVEIRLPTQPNWVVGRVLNYQMFSSSLMKTVFLTTNEAATLEVGADETIWFPRGPFSISIDITSNGKTGLLPYSPRDTPVPMELDGPATLTLNPSGVANRFITFKVLKRRPTIQALPESTPALIELQASGDLINWDTIAVGAGDGQESGFYRMRLNK